MAVENALYKGVTRIGVFHGPERMLQLYMYCESYNRLLRGADFCPGLSPWFSDGNNVYN